MHVKNFVISDLTTHVVLVYVGELCEEVELLNCSRLGTQCIHHTLHRLLTIRKTCKVYIYVSAHHVNPEKYSIVKLNLTLHNIDVREHR